MTTPDPIHPASGDLDPIIERAMHRGIASFNTTRLIDAAQALVDACMTADEMEELSEEVDGSLLDAVNDAIAALRPANPPATAAGVGEADDGLEDFEAGRREGYGDAIQEIDVATGGDGEYRWSNDPDRCVDERVMKQRIIERFTTPASHDALIARVRSTLLRAQTFVNGCVDAGELHPDGCENPCDVYDALDALLTDLDARDGG